MARLGEELFCVGLDGGRGDLTKDDGGRPVVRQACLQVTDDGTNQETRVAVELGCGRGRASGSDRRFRVKEAGVVLGGWQLDKRRSMLQSWVFW